MVEDHRPGQATFVAISAAPTGNVASGVASMDLGAGVSRRTSFAAERVTVGVVRTAVATSALERVTSGGPSCIVALASVGTVRVDAPAFDRSPSGEGPCPSPTDADGARRAGPARCAHLSVGITSAIAVQNADALAPRAGGPQPDSRGALMTWAHGGGEVSYGGRQTGTGGQVAYEGVFRRS